MRHSSKRRSLKTVMFWCLDRPIWVFWTVYIHSSRPRSFWYKDHIHLDFRTVHFRRPFTFGLLDRQVKYITARFQSFGPSSLCWNQINKLSSFFLVADCILLYANQIQPIRTSDSEAEFTVWISKFGKWTYARKVWVAYPPVRTVRMNSFSWNLLN